MDFLREEQSKYPTLAGRYAALSELFGRKLYHELTVELLLFVKDDATSIGSNWIDLYQRFIVTFQDKINQLSLIRICGEIARRFQDPAQAVAFLESILTHLQTKKDKVTSTVNPHATEAVLMCRMYLGSFQLRLKQETQVKKLLAENKDVVESLVGADPLVHAAYYRVACEYYSAVGPADKFYKSALMFLAYSLYEDIKPAERFSLAINLSVAALTGENVFNFGEVLATPILSALKGTDKEWLSDLLHAFNRGDIDQFNIIVGNNRAQYNAQPALVNKEDYVKEILALMVLIFHRPSNERNIPFADIAFATRLPQNQVEWLVMRALSLGLIKGSIDQVESIVSVKWVQPRVLEKDQLGELQDRLAAWGTKVNDTLLYVEDQTPELFQ
ncbi:26S proteasome non-ATPase regulatory subunit 13 [Thraustotheca clavata]|uniref:26S proteasome non-ATPase regulatory subunit 13 n=1 Tax=Thraustotheca clavata TaxID=74557 RepID=A0A1V9ZXT2_9STRA|nr:26S proteasome non-ATPase regulatory subunit 13 [Thraustotheca clavata]